MHRCTGARRVCLAAAMILAAELRASRPWAQPRRDGGADERVAAAAADFAEGTRQFQRGAYSLAALAFERAQSLAPHPHTRFNLARSLEAAGDLASALREWTSYRGEVSAPGDVRDAEARIAALRERPVELVVVSEPLGAEVTVDAESSPSGVTPLRLRIRPGAHVLVLRRAGHRERVQRLDVAPCVAQDLALRLTPEPLPPPPPGPPQGAPPRGLTAAERVLGRRRGGLFGWLSGRAAATFGLAWPRRSLRFANGFDLTLFVRRYFAAQLHILRVEDAGSPLTVLGELGWVYAADDIDIGFFLHAGSLLDCDQACPEGTSRRELIAGGTVRADVVLHPHVGVGLFARFSWIDLEIARSESLLSSLGISVSLFL